MLNVMDFYEPFETRPEQHMVPGKNHNTVPYMVPFRIPHRIAEAATPVFSEETQVWIDKAHQRLLVSAAHGGYGGFVEGLLLRTEALGSSHIEDNPTGFRQLCLTFAGATAREWNKEAVNNLWVLVELLGSASETPITKQVLLKDHENLLSGKKNAGKFREHGISRIGESIIESPYICPPNSEVDGLLSDWVRFIARADIPLAAKIALGHAQFESIHPFGDGNGRTGRAVIQRMLLLEGYRTLPISVALHALREHYFDSLGAFREGDPEPIVKIIALAITAASTGVSEHLPDIEHLLQGWKDKVDANSQLRKNTAKALEWIVATPAFTADKLAEGIAVSGKTAQRIIATLLEADILSQSKKTHPQKSTKRTFPIYEAREVTELTEKVEETTRECAINWWHGGNDEPGYNSPPPPNPPSTPESIASRIFEEGSHPILSLPTKSGYDLGISLLELFVFHHGRLVLRQDLQDTKIVGIGGWGKISILRGSYSVLDLDVSEENPEVVSKFSAAASNVSVFPGREVSRFWSNLKKDFEDLLKFWAIWQVTGRYDKYPGPRIIEFSTSPEYSSLMGRCADIAFHESLASFLEKPIEQKDYLSLRGNQIYSGYSPSLFEATKTLQRIESDQMFPFYNVPTRFSEEQQDSLESIELELKKYKSSNILKKLANKKKKAPKEWDTKWTEILENLVGSPESKYPTEEFIYDYLRIARNPRSHNRTMLDAEEWFLYNSEKIAAERGIKNIPHEAVDRIFGIIKRIETEVLGLSATRTDEWYHQTFQTAIKVAEEVDMAVYRNEKTKTNISAVNSLTDFRRHYGVNPKSHRCVSRDGFNRHNASQTEGKIVDKRCAECGGFLRMLYMESEISVSMKDENGTDLLPENQVSCLICEGQFGYTTLQFFYDDKGSVKKAIEAIYKSPDDLNVEVIQNGINVWSGVCERQRPIALDSLTLKSKELFDLNI